IKVDDPRRDQPARDQVIDVDRGKRSLFLDLRTPAGCDALWHLIATADVVVENLREGKLARLGFDPEAIALRNPRAVLVSTNAFGFGGPWSARPGWEQNAQAATGMQVRRGGRSAPPKTLTYAFSDYVCGMLGAYAAMLGLYERAHTGRGGRLR